MKILALFGKALKWLLKVLFVKRSCCDYSDSCCIKDDPEEGEK